MSMPCLMPLHQSMRKSKQANGYGTVNPCRLWLIVSAQPPVTITFIFFDCYSLLEFVCFSPHIELLHVTPNLSQLLQVLAILISAVFLLRIPCSLWLFEEREIFTEFFLSLVRGLCQLAKI